PNVLGNFCQQATMSASALKGDWPCSSRWWAASRTFSGTVQSRTAFTPRTPAWMENECAVIPSPDCRATTGTGSKALGVPAAVCGGSVAAGPLRPACLVPGGAVRLAAPTKAARHLESVGDA